ncbi:MAG TPA: hypothetical protein VF077_05830 [Nitrospiraceae bacterium]
MRVFLYHLRMKQYHAEILSYDRATHMARVRVKGDIEYDRIFLPDAKHNREDFQLVTLEDDDAKLPRICEKLRAGS